MHFVSGAVVGAWFSLILTAILRDWYCYDSAPLPASLQMEKPRHRQIKQIAY